MTKRYDLAVIGGGSAGLTAAAIAGRVGARTILIDKERLGGDCTHYGCIPSKSLIRCAKVAHTARHAHRYGVLTPQVTVDYGRVAAYVRQAIATIESHETPEMIAQQGVEVAFGGARFLSPTRIRIGKREIEATSSVLAVGSRAFAPPLAGLDETGAMDHVGLFELTALPPRIAVLGAGPVGTEMGQALARLGAEVTILQRGERILKRDDGELADLLAGYLREEIRLVCNATVRQVRAARGAKEIVFEVDGNESTLACDEILVAVGRKPRLEGLDLETAGVAFTERGVIVDAKLRTTARNIWACGDCTGSMQFTHFAEAQARVAARNALFIGSQSFEHEPTPWVTFTDPELAHVGMTETEAGAAHDKVEVFQYSYSKLDRAICEGETRGMAKIVTAPNGRILGASILGPHAGEAITEVVIAMNAGITLQKLSSFVHPYPVMNRIIRRLGDERFLARGVGTVTRKLFGRYRGRRAIHRRSMKPSDEHYAVSDFTRELVADVKAGGYGVRAWMALLVRSWERSIDDIRASPARTRSLVRWSCVGVVIGAGVIGMALTFQSSGTALRATALWLPWYAGTVFYVLTHLGMVDGAPGGSRAGLMLPNGLSFLRLGLAPLALWPCSIVPAHPSTATVYALTLVLLALTDALDGWIARKRGLETRMGRMLDPLADVAFLAFLAAGLFVAGVLPTSLFVLLILRYPGALVGVVTLYFLRGPGPLRPTAIGRATSLVTSAILTGLTLVRLLQLEWLPTRLNDWCVVALYLATGTNLAYLAFRAMTWRASEAD